MDYNYATRYQTISSDVNSHSDDEYNAKTGVYVIKTLAYQSDNATAFFRRLDCKIREVERMMGRRSQQQICQRPKIPIIYEFEKTPRNVPIDFYRPEWFNERDHSQKVVASNLSEVAFVPVKDLPPGTKQHPDERLGNLGFNIKYWESTIQEYKIEPGTPDSSERDSEDGCSDDESVDLNAPNANRDVDNNGLSEEFIYNGESDLELDEEDYDNEMEENQDKVGGDVVISDAWETRQRVNWQQEDMYEKV
ncbi:hypothetical protein O181_129306, partial [Austropuccinia psidii MF-1]|nr:hypothetical protein [Austropuccinia psidii MF-1]